MGDTGLAALVVRSLLSLAVVLAIVGVGYLVARRRGGRSVTMRPRATVGSGRRPRRTPNPLEVVARVGLSRSSVLVAVRFGDRVVLVATADGAPASVVTEMSAEQWEELQMVREAIDPTELAAASESVAPGPTSVVEGIKPGFVEALRQATARYG